MTESIDYSKIYSIFLDHYEMCKNDPETIIMQRASKTPLKAPLFISWEITSECNLLCQHCRAAYNTSRKKRKFLTLKDYTRVVQDFGQNEVHRIGITGGEPFLHPHLFDILSLCKNERLDVILYTNATLIGTNEASVLSTILTKDDIIHVSLDGGTEETNDAQRGEGVFKKVLLGLEELCKKDINIRLNVVPTIYNENSLEELCDIAIYYRVKEFGASPLMTSGRAFASTIAPDYEKLFQTEMIIAEKLKKTTVKYIGGISGTVHNYLNLPGFIESDIFSLKRNCSNFKLCDAGNRKLFIDANGECYPCSLFAAHSTFSNGNIYENSLHNIWTGDKWNILREGIEITSNKCKECKLFSLCNGGCMALAYQSTGKMGNIDPRCPNAYK